MIFVLSLLQEDDRTDAARNEQDKHDEQNDCRTGTAVLFCFVGLFGSSPFASVVRVFGCFGLSVVRVFLVEISGRFGLPFIVIPLPSVGIFGFIISIAGGFGVCRHIWRFACREIEHGKLRSVFVRRFEDRFERVGDFGFVRLPGGTAATGDVLVPARTVAELGICDLSVVSGVAVASFREGEKDAEGSWGFVADEVERVEPPRAEDVERQVTGVVRFARGGAAFVGECLVPARVVAERGLREGQELTATARLRWDKRRRRWDWVIA